MRSPLGKAQLQSPLTPEEIFDKKQKAWIDGEGLNLNTKQIKQLKQDQQWAIEIIGNYIYGKRR